MAHHPGSSSDEDRDSNESINEFDDSAEMLNNVLRQLQDAQAAAIKKKQREAQMVKEVNALNSNYVAQVDEELMKYGTVLRETMKRQAAQERTRMIELAKTRSDLIQLLQLSIERTRTFGDDLPTSCDESVQMAERAIGDRNTYQDALKGSLDIEVSWEEGDDVLEGEGEDED